MADFDRVPDDLERKLQAIRRPPPPQNSTRWQKILFNAGLWSGCAIALYYLIVVSGAKAGKGEARLYIFGAVFAGGILGWLAGFVVDALVIRARRREYDDAWDQGDDSPAEGG